MGYPGTVTMVDFKIERDKSKVRCYKCQDFGHYARDCSAPIRKKENANIDITSDDLKADSKQKRIVERVATSHMTVHSDSLVCT